MILFADFLLFFLDYACFPKGEGLLHVLFHCRRVLEHCQLWCGNLIFSLGIPAPFLGLTVYSPFIFISSFCSEAYELRFYRLIIIFVSCRYLIYHNIRLFLHGSNRDLEYGTL
jgi:hypothetical protein